MTDREHAAIIHGHFYQPPREDPWLDEVPLERSAQPYHDWNERIERECYRAVVAARIPTGTGRIATIVNTLQSISFDVGPTLCSWLERAAPDTYAGIVEADRASCTAHGGHGNAIAMPYHHVILPLASRRDKTTEVRWGMQDFQARFGRTPEGMWLPETAVDDETLDVLAQEGIAFTILAPHQVRHAPPSGMPGRYRTRNGRSLAVFVYDGPISHDVAFGPLLKDARLWAARMLGDGSRRLAAVATDGETYGHHHRFGEMALAAVIAELQSKPRMRLENFASYLARHQPRRDLEVLDATSWSCVHGIERWRTDCGCKMHPERVTQQAWRAVLRVALQWLADVLHQQFEQEGRAIFRDPWSTRDDYGAVVVSGGSAVPEFVRTQCVTEDPALRQRGAELLEMEHNLLRMFTSCGWFFDDLGGLESRQVLQYAARAIELSGKPAGHLQDELRERLRSASSNDPQLGTGRDIFDRGLPHSPPAVRIAAGYRASTTIGAEFHDACPHPFSIEDLGDIVAVTHVATGRVSRLRAEVERPSLGRLVVRITPDGEQRTHLVPLADFPETYRAEVERAIRREIIDATFSESARQALAAGEELERVASGVLQRAVDALRTGVAAEVTMQVEALLDLFDVMQRPFPFDVQTQFYRLWQTADAERAARLTPLARRLGFE